MKGIEILVEGSVGHMSGFMGQSGKLVVLEDAGDSLGDSLYEAQIFVRGEIKNLGVDCVEKEVRAEHLQYLEDLFKSEKIDCDKNLRDMVLHERFIISISITCKIIREPKNEL